MFEVVRKLCGGRVRFQLRAWTTRERTDLARNGSHENVADPLRRAEHGRLEFPTDEKLPICRRADGGCPGVRVFMGADRRQQRGHSDLLLGIESSNERLAVKVHRLPFERGACITRDHALA